MTNPAPSDKTAAVAEQSARVAPEKPPSKKGASKKTDAPKAKNGAKVGKTKAGGPQEGSQSYPGAEGRDRDPQQQEGRGDCIDEAS